MKDIKLIYLYLFIISATVICFEIISTRISSVIFVNNYAFIILSLAILGLAAGGIYSYYRVKIEIPKTPKLLFNYLLLAGSSLFIFIFSITVLEIINPFVYFLLLFLPFFFFGVIYAQLFKIFADKGFILYAYDLAGAAVGSIASLFIIDIFGGPNSVLLLGVLIFCLAGIYIIQQYKVKRIAYFYSIVVLSLIFLIINGDKSLLGKVPIGHYSEKDFYYVYPDAEEISEIAESRWSIYGRSDLVQYSNQDEVKQLFVDGAAGSQMYRFNGDLKKPDQLLYNLLLVHSNTIPFFFLNRNEKNNMLVIGPGGGKEVLIGLLSGVEQITGVEINPDFVNIVKDYKEFNGGIYTNFPNVRIEVEEGRHYLKKVKQKFDLIVMALPSTEQLQSIDNFAMNENYLLTVEAIKDYLKILTPEGRLIFTVHNNWELVRLIITSMSAFNSVGVNNQEVLNHFLILEQDYAPTIVIKKNSFTKDEIPHIESIIKTIPKNLPEVTYLPYYWGKLKNTGLNNFLSGVKENRISIDEFIINGKYDTAPCLDDSPYFYKIKKGIPVDYLWLLFSVIILNLLLVGIPLILIKKRIKKVKISAVVFPMVIFLCIGAGFMIIEVSLFQKLILFLGSPTISLSVLLSSILIGMGIGSFFGGKIFKDDFIKRLKLTFLSIVLTGILLFVIFPLLLNSLLEYSLFTCAIICFLLILPFGFLLGIPFPTAIQYLKQKKMEDFIPWMYGINGSMSVLGSVAAVNFSMMWGFSLSFFIGISFYFILFLVLFKVK
jgi:spermidine synthase